MHVLHLRQVSGQALRDLHAEGVGLARRRRGAPDGLALDVHHGPAEALAELPAHLLGQVLAVSIGDPKVALLVPHVKATGAMRDHPVLAAAHHIAEDGVDVPCLRRSRVQRLLALLEGKQELAKGHGVHVVPV